MSPFGRAGAVLALSGVVIACSMFLPSPDSGRIFEPLTLSISNNTTLQITLRVNGQVVGPFARGFYGDPIDVSLLPAPPWSIEALTPSGRVLLHFNVKPGDVWRTNPDAQGHSSSNGAGARADLSCGRLDVWSGSPMLGPMPPTEFPPGDCDP